MSSPPVKYARYFDFTTFATLNPDKPLPGASVDQEYNRIKSTTDQTIDRLALIQNDDGTLKGSSLQAGSIGTAQLEDGCVTTPKLATGAVNNNALQLQSVGGWNIMAATITDDLIAPGQITGDKLQDNTITAQQLGSGAVDNDALQLQVVNEWNIADGCITNVKLHDNNVNDAKIAPSTITSRVLADGCVTNPKLADLSVSTAKVQDGAITAVKIAPGAITGSQIPDGSVAGVKLVPGSIGTVQLADGGVTLAKLAPNSVDGSKIVDGSINPVDLSPTTVALMTAAGNPRGAWLTGTNYATKDAVTNGNGVFVCITAHLSGVFATDLAAGRWYQTGTIYDQSLNKADTVQFAGFSADVKPQTNIIQSLGTAVLRWLKVWAQDGDFSGNLNVGGVITGAGAPPNANKIINGDFRISQHFGANGFAPTAGGPYQIDRWYFGIGLSGKFTAAQNANGGGYPSSYALGVTSLSAYAPLAADFFNCNQTIEANNLSDLYWGGVRARPITISFSVYSNLTGTFTGYLRNYANNRFYVFPYVIAAANTWTQIAVTIPGDQGGAWVLAGNGGGLVVGFDIGSGANYITATPNVWTAGQGVTIVGSQKIIGTNGAVWFVTNIKLEVGAVATPFVPDDVETSLAKCRRYFQRPSWGSGEAVCQLNATSTTAAGGKMLEILPMRATPTIFANGGFIGFSQNLSGNYGLTGINFAANAAGQVSCGNVTIPNPLWTLGGVATIGGTGNALEFDAEL